MRTLNPRRLTKLLERAIRLCGLQEQFAASTPPSPALNFVFVSVHKIRQINTAFLNCRNRTDVIAFDLRPNRETGQSQFPDNEPPAEEDDDVLGEIYVCPVVAARVARQYQTAPEDELILYLVHGLLHLAGYRDHTPQQQRRMREAEERVMNKLRKEFSPASIISLEYHLNP